MKKIILIFLMFLAGCSSLRKVDVLEHGNEVFNQECYIQEKVPPFSKDIKMSSQYFQRVIDGDREVDATGCREDEYLDLFKDKIVKGAGDSSPYWRWEIEFTLKEIQEILNHNLYEMGNKRKNIVYTLENSSWVSKTLDKNPVGNLEKISVLQRGVSGIATELLIKGSKGTFIVTKEYNIRSALGFRNFPYKNRKIPVLGKTGKIINSDMNMLPSGFLAFDKKENRIKIYGGGFGHGVGLPQWTAKDLAEQNYSYEDILERYYPGTELGNSTKFLKENDNIKVLLNINGAAELKNIVLTSEKGLRISDGKSSVRVPAGMKGEFSVSSGTVTVKLQGKTLISTKNEFQISSESRINVQGKKYTYLGTFTIKPFEGSRMLLVNRVSLEDYLKGVVPSEMPVSFGLEALKAQAVAARTYAVKSITGNKYSKYGVDLMDTVSSQVYNNTRESEIANTAIRATSREILIFNNQPVTTYFYSTSSGVSALPEEVW